MGGIATFEGKNAIVTLYETKIEIKKKGFLKSVMGQADRTIPLVQLSGVQFKKGSFMSGVGYIRFMVGTHDRNTGGIYGSLLNAASDENTIPFVPSNNNEALIFKNKIEEMIDRIHSSAKGGTIINQQSSAEELKKFKELLDEGIITEEEFLSKKRQLLS
jgi:hypothetical protein